MSQTVIITRAPGRTPVPEKQSIAALAAHQATMVLFLSTSLTEKLQRELLAGGYPEHARGGRIQGDVARGEDLPLHRRDAA